MNANAIENNPNPTNPKNLPSRLDACHLQGLIDAATVLGRIADCYDKNDLDDDARKFWGIDLEHQNSTPPYKIELYASRGGIPLLNLQNCLNARDALTQTILVLGQMEQKKPEERLKDRFATAIKNAGGNSKQTMYGLYESNQTSFAWEVVLQLLRMKAFSYNDDRLAPNE